MKISTIIRILLNLKIANFTRLFLISLFIFTISLSDGNYFFDVAIANNGMETVEENNKGTEGTGEEAGTSAAESDAGKAIMNFSPSAPTSDSMHSDATQLHLQTVGTLAAGTAIAGGFGYLCASSLFADVSSCIMAALGIVQIGISTASILLAEEQKGIAADTPLPNPYGESKDGNKAKALPSDPKHVIETTKAQIKGAGITVNEHKGDICWKGKCFNPINEEMNPKNFAKNGFSKKQSKTIMKALSKAGKAYEENLAKFEATNKHAKGKNENMKLVNVGVHSASSSSSKGKKGTKSPTRLSKFLRRMKKNLKSKKNQRNKHLVFKKKYGDNLIGVGANNIFQMVHRRHEILKKNRLFF